MTAYAHGLAEIIQMTPLANYMLFSTELEKKIPISTQNCRNPKWLEYKDIHNAIIRKPNTFALITFPFFLLILKIDF